MSYFENTLFFAIILSEKNKFDKVFILKQEKNLVKTWKRGGMRETMGGGFLLTSWLIAIKYPKQITLFDTNTVILLIIVIIIDA